MDVRKFSKKAKASTKLTFASRLILVPVVLVSCSNEPNLAQQLELATSNIDTPFMIDPETRLDAVETANSNSLTFTYSLVNKSAEGFHTKGFVDLMTDQLHDSTMSNRLIKSFYDQGVILNHQYVDLNGVYITNIVLNKVSNHH